MDILRSTAAAMGLATCLCAPVPSHSQNFDVSQIGNLSRDINRAQGVGIAPKHSKSEDTYSPGIGTETLLRALFSDTEKTKSLEGITIQRPDKSVYVQLKPQIDWSAAALAFSDHATGEASPQFAQYYELHKELLLALHVIVAKQFMQKGEKTFTVEAISVDRSDARQSEIADNQSLKERTITGYRRASGKVSEHTIAAASDLKVDGIPAKEIFSYAISWGIPAGLYGENGNFGAVHLGAMYSRYWRISPEVCKMLESPSPHLMHGKALFTDGPLPQEAQNVMVKLLEHYEKLDKRNGRNSEACRKGNHTVKIPSAPLITQEAPKKPTTQKDWTKDAFGGG